MKTALRVLEEAAGAEQPAGGTPSGSDDEKWMDEINDSDLGNDDADDGQPPDGQVVKEVPKGETPPATPPAKAEVPPKSETPPETPPSTPKAETPPETPKGETPPAAKAETPPAEPPAKSAEEVERERVAARQKVEDDLVKHYQIDEDTAAKLISEPETVLPRILAKVHMTAFADAMNTIQQRMPAFFEQYQQQGLRVQEGANQFFSEWPELKAAVDKDAKVGEVISRTMTAYRAANPKMSPQDIIREGGLAALVALKLPIPQRLLAAHNIDAPATPPGKSGYSAPGAGAPQPAGVPQKSDNVFTVIAEEDLTGGA